MREARRRAPRQERAGTACRAALLSCLAVSVAATAAASEPEARPFPGYQNDPAYVRSQALFDAYLQRRRTGQAYGVAMNGLVWRGDKHAQYMVGYMHHTGEGASRDPVRACAWFRLAAERGEALLKAARDAACDVLVVRLAARAAALFAELQREYGDRRVLRRLIARDQRLLRASLTRHATLRDGNLRSMAARRSGLAEHGFSWHQQVQRRIEARIDYLQGYVELGELKLLDPEPAPPHAP